MLLIGLTVCNHVDINKCDVQSVFVGNQTAGNPKFDLSSPQLTEEHEPMTIMGCFDVNGLTGLQVVSGVFNSTTKFFTSALTLENHGNSTSSSCKPYLLNPSTQHTIT